MMQIDAVIVAGFGTTHADARRLDLAPVRQAVAGAFPGAACAEAYTSGMVRAALARRGQPVPDVAAALRQAACAGARRVLVQPTHVIPGEEYEKVLAAAQQCGGLFESLAVGRPLLWAEEDYRALALAVAGAYPVAEGEALVLMGHGSAHAANSAYQRLNRVLGELGLRQLTVATVEGTPRLEDALEWLRRGGFGAAALAPLLLAAGDHAKNDMAGPAAESWQSRLTRQGLKTRALVRGLGRLPAVQQLYKAHALEACGREKGA